MSQAYASYRPSYPLAAFTYACQQCHLAPGSVLVDVGCGTGISSRLFAQHGLRVVGIEPNNEMRMQSERDSAGLAVSYQDGTAEETGLPSGAADAVAAAQAFHWFDTEAALTEFFRILRPRGATILLWNERDNDDPFTRAYGQLMRAYRDAVIELPRTFPGQPLLDCPLFEEGKLTFFANQQVLTREGLLGRAFSTSYAPREEQAAKQLTAQLELLFDQYARNNAVQMIYETSVYTAFRVND